MHVIGVTGKSSAILQAFSKVHPTAELWRIGGDLATFNYQGLRNEKYSQIDRYILCAGVLHPKTILEQNIEEITASLAVNMTSTIALCELILQQNSKARIAVIGSVSGISGSYDTVYAAAKAGLHQYVVNKKLAPEQQLVAVAPGIIGDAGMTLRRQDLTNLVSREAHHPKKRFITAMEVAKMLHYLLFIDSGYTSNTVINMTGGEVRC